MPLRRLSLPEESEVGIANEVDHLISGVAVELLTEPINRQVSGCHGIKQEILQVLQGLGIGENGFCFVHAPTIADQS